MAQNLDLLLTIFPFEKRCFAHTSLPVEYIGHPLVKKIASHIPLPTFHQRYNLNPAKKILALFPGSRETEIRRNLPIQLEAAREMARQFSDLQIAISLAHPSLAPMFPKMAPLIEPQHRIDLMKNGHLALATSGTVTLELALCQTPAVVNFAIRPIDLFLAQKIFRINLPFYCIVNIILEKRVYPELFGPHLTVPQLIKEAQILWSDEKERKICIADCLEAKKQLGESDAAARAAELI